MTDAARRVAVLLERELGLAPGSVGERVIVAAVRRRMDATATDGPTYAALVAADRRELGELVEAVTVPETWFFRYPDSFRHLAEWAVARRAHIGLGRQLRVLSAPCSTGEEPYSAAVTLLGAGFSPGSFAVEAVDVSRRAVEFARAGVFGATAFREAGTEPVRERFFTHTSGGFALIESVRAAVRFRPGNLNDPASLANDSQFDAVFCRNLFIYLTPDARRRVVAVIDRLLAPGGVVYVGHAEPLGLMDARFKSVSRPQAFAFVRAEAPAPAPAPASLRLDEPRGSPPWTPPDKTPVVRGGEPLGSSAPEAAPKPSLAAARAAADRGAVAEAAALVDRVLAAAPAADALALRGVLWEMSGQLADAEKCFARALYLDPRHYDALLHMMVLSQNKGDAAGAANYRRRADAALRGEGRK